MKKLAILCIAISALVLGSCSKDENAPPRITLTKEDMVSRWIIQQEKNPSTGQWKDYTKFGDDYMWAQFDEDGAYTGKRAEEQYTGTWTVSKDIITCKADTLQIYFRLKEPIKNEEALFSMRVNNQIIGTEVKAVRKKITKQGF